MRVKGTRFLCKLGNWACMKHEYGNWNWDSEFRALIYDPTPFEGQTSNVYSKIGRVRLHLFYNLSDFLFWFLFCFWACNYHFIFVVGLDDLSMVNFCNKQVADIVLISNRQVPSYSHHVVCLMLGRIIFFICLFSTSL